MKKLILLCLLLAPLSAFAQTSVDELIRKDLQRRRHDECAARGLSMDLVNLMCVDANGISEIPRDRPPRVQKTRPQQTNNDAARKCEIPGQEYNLIHRRCL